MLAEICLASAMMLGLMLAVRLVKSMLLMPVKASRNIRASLVLRAEGSCPALEHTAQAALWLLHSGAVEGKLIIADAGLDTESRTVAELLARDTSTVTLTEPAQCGDCL